MIKKYLTIIKPKIILGNCITFMGGFCLASQGCINYSLLLHALIGTSLIIASACTFNNIIDRDIDIKMTRTRNRVLVNGTLSIKVGFFYAIILGHVGFLWLYFKGSALATLLAAFGFLVYVIIYSIFLKRCSIHSTIIGSLSGAIPPVIGYCIVTNTFNYVALILMIMFMLWQIPHSYAVIILHLKDYQNANLPVLPVVKGMQVAKKHIILYILAFMISALMLSILGYTGYKYLGVVTIVSALWFVMALSGYNRTLNDTIWARKIFIFSIITITLVSLMMFVDFIKLA